MLPAAASADEKSLYRAEMRSLNASIAAALAKTADRESKAHLEGARTRSQDPGPEVRSAASSSGIAIRLGSTTPRPAGRLHHSAVGRGMLAATRGVWFLRESSQRLVHSGY